MEKEDNGGALDTQNQFLPEPIQGEPPALPEPLKIAIQNARDKALLTLGM
jgi:hypothetical protein